MSTLNTSNITAHAFQPLAVNPQDPRLSPYFRVMHVLRTESVTPRMRRVVLGGASLEGFDFECPPDSLAPHVHLEIPPEGVASPQWPELRQDRSLRVTKPNGPLAAVERTYSLRWVDMGKGEIAVDIVLHGHGPGASFGMRAKPGDPVGVWWPHGSSHAPVDWYLIAGDHTALPGIAWLLERLPATARGHVFIEVPDAGEEQQLEGPPGMSVEWIHLDGRLPGADTRLRDAALSVEWPTSGRNFVWVGAERGTARALRQHARKVLKLHRSQYSIVNYWRQGAAEGTFRAEE